MADILQQDQYDMLPGDLQALEDTGRWVEEAEWLVVDRYRQSSRYNDALTFSTGTRTDGRVRLKGWAEEDDGTPAPEQMDAGLLKRLRRVIAAVAGALYEARTRDKNIEKISEGQRSITYHSDTDRAPDIATALFRPLTRYDARIPW